VLLMILRPTVATGLPPQRSSLDPRPAKSRPRFVRKQKVPELHSSALRGLQAGIEDVARTCCSGPRLFSSQCGTTADPNGRSALQGRNFSFS
jgi:hypothetical protein